MPPLRSMPPSPFTAIAVLLALLILAASVFGMENDDTSRVVPPAPRAVPDSIDWSGGILYGPGFAYYLHADTGWVMDHGLEQIFDANSVFRQQGYEPMESPVYITSVIWHKDSGVTVQGVADLYGRRFASDYSSSQIKPCSALVTARGDSVLVVQFLADSERVYERVAFCDAPGIIVGIMIWSRYPGNFFESMPAFAATVKSYHFLTDKVRIDQPTRPPVHQGDSVERPLPRGSDDGLASTCGLRRETYLGCRKA